MTFRGISPKQDAVLAQIALGNDGGHHPRTLMALEKKGLIIKFNERLAGFPPVVIDRYYMPLPVHIEWCEWCSMEVRDERTR